MLISLKNINQNKSSVSSGIGGISISRSEHAKEYESWPTKVCRHITSMALINLTAGNIAIDLNISRFLSGYGCGSQCSPSVRHTATSSMGMLISCLPEAARLLSRNSR